MISPQPSLNSPSTQSQRVRDSVSLTLVESLFLNIWIQESTLLFILELYLAPNTGITLQLRSTSNLSSTLVSFAEETLIWRRIKKRHSFAWTSSLNFTRLTLQTMMMPWWIISSVTMGMKTEQMFKLCWNKNRFNSNSLTITGLSTKNSIHNLSVKWGVVRSRIWIN